MKHTKLPWVLDDRIKLRFNFYSNDSTGSIIGTVDGFNLAPRPDDEKQANAEFIVKACNNHYQLLEAIKTVLYGTPLDEFNRDEDGLIDYPNIEKIIEVLKEAVNQVEKK